MSFAGDMFVMGRFNFLRWRDVRDAGDLISFVGKMFMMGRFHYLRWRDVSDGEI